MTSNKIFKNLKINVGKLKRETRIRPFIKKALEIIITIVGGIKLNERVLYNVSYS